MRAAGDTRDVAAPRAGVARNVRMIGLLGPAFVAAVAFVDPGNIAINASAGAGYRYLLLWTVITASLMAVVVQYLSAKLGLATGTSLAEVCRATVSTPTRIVLWLVAELVVVMTDVAEFVGAAIALNLLFGLPLPLGGVITAAATMLILRLRVHGRDAFPVVVVALLGVLVLGFGYLTVNSSFDPQAAMKGIVPRFADSQSALLACGIVGATVMPHALFLHSSLVGGLRAATTDGRRALTIGFLRRDIVLAMTVAGVINVLMLVVTASLPMGGADSLEQVHATFAAQHGAVFATVFAVSLLASGLASACAGVYSGQAIMQGFLHRNSNIWLRRGITTVPALTILATVPDPTRALVLSQVVLSFGLPFALVPLLVFTAQGRVMGSLVNGLLTSALGMLITAIVMAMNGLLIVRLFLS